MFGSEEPGSSTSNCSMGVEEGADPGELARWAMVSSVVCEAAMVVKLRGVHKQKMKLGMVKLSNKHLLLPDY